MSDNNTVTLTIDDCEVTVPEGTVIADAAKMIGIDIPVFCHHPKLEPVGMCRMCLVEVATPRTNRETGEVEIAWWPKLQTACTTPVSEGMVVRTTSEAVKQARVGMLAFLLTSHPLDCPTCDKGGECPLQNLTVRYGADTSNFYFEDKMHLDKRVPLGDLIILDQERCILCSRCIRFCDEIADDPVLAFHERGRHTYIISVSDPGFDSQFSGNTTDICPVGALATADFRFGARPWEMTSVATICAHCPVGCNMTFHVRASREARREVIKRVMPRQNERVNEIWICDKGRFAHHFADHPDRLTHPMIRQGGKLVGTTWNKALGEIVTQLKASGESVAGIAGDRLSNEDLFAFQRLIRGLGSPHVTHYPDWVGGRYLVSQIGVGAGTNFAEMGPETAILVIATDLHQEAPIWWLRVKQAAERGATLIVANGRHTRLDRYAAHQIRYTYGEEVATLNAMLGTVKPSPGREVEGLEEALAVARAFRADDEVMAAAQAFAEAENAVVIAGSEGVFRPDSCVLAQAAGNLLIATGHVGRPNNGLLMVWPGANIQGALDMGVFPGYGPGYRSLEVPGSGYAEMIEAIRRGMFKGVLLAGADPAGDSPAAAQALRESNAFIVVQDLFLTETAKLADVVLPTQSIAEREGTYTSNERRVQRFYPAIPPIGESRPDWAILESLRERLGLGEAAPSAAAIMLQIANEVPQYAGLTYQRLAKAETQWPPVGGDNLFYSGTATANERGLGVQWPSAAEDPSTMLRMAPAEAGVPLSATGDQIVVVPIRLLYDRETALSKTGLLHGHVPVPHLCLSQADAERLGLIEGDIASFEFEGQEVRVVTVVDDDVPPGVALLPIRLQPSATPSEAFVVALTKMEVSPA